MTLSSWPGTSGVDGGVEFIGLIQHGEHCEPFALRKEDAEAVRAHLTSALERAERHGMTTNIRAYLNETGTTGPRPIPAMAADAPQLARAACFWPWLSIAVNAEGGVGPCCAFWDPDAESITAMSLEEAWVSPRLQEARRRLIAHDLPAYCLNCPSNLTDSAEQLRHEVLHALRWRQMGLGKKVLASLRANGWRETVQRGKAWVRRHGPWAG